MTLEKRFERQIRLFELKKTVIERKIGQQMRLFELPPVALELLLDLLLERTLLLLEELDVAPDLSLQLTLLDFEQTLLLLEFLFEELKSWKRHEELTLRNDYRFMTFHR